MVFDPRPENPLVIVGSDFFLTVISNTLSQKGGNVIWFYCKECCPDNLIIKGCQVIWVFEHDICCTPNLLHRPGVTKTEAVSDRAIASGKDFVEIFRIDPVGEFLCSFNIRDLEERVNSTVRVPYLMK